MDSLDFKLDKENISIKPHVQDLGMLKQLNAIGIIGGDFLEQYKIYINPVKKRVRI